jgi:fido (protein-threonine AMPylation protein)
VREALLLGHSQVELWLRENAASHALTLNVVTDIHRVLFEGVWPDFAGKLRGPAPRYLPARIQFGKYPAVSPERVPQECVELFDSLGKFILQLDDMVHTDPDTDHLDDILKVAAYTHCELIRIHPFANGNGRTSRMCINFFAWRYGFAPISYDRPHDEYAYLGANRVWLERKRIEAIVDFLQTRAEMNSHRQR